MTTLRVEEGGRARTLAASDFPVPLGGPGSVVPVAASAGPLAWLGMADGEVFVQPAPGGAVLCNGARLSASHWLCDGDVLRLEATRVEVRLRAGRDVEVYAALDGQETFAFADGDHVAVTGSPRRLKLVKAPGRDYYAVLRTKLKWGEAGAPPRRA